MDTRHQKATPRILGITGPIACGKTTVGDILLELGALSRIDADQVVHDLEGPGTEVTGRIADAFGDVLQANGSVDRSRLGAVVFADPQALTRLEAILHPAVHAEIRRQVSEWEGQRGVVIVDAVKLLQSPLLSLVETVWVVRCTREVQMTRLTEVRQMGTLDAERRIRAQPDFQHPRVSVVVENSGSRMDLRRHIEEQWSGFLGSGRS